MKTGKNKKGFMCKSESATAVCMASEPLSVIVQRRADNKSANGAKLMNNSKYIRLGDTSSHNCATSSSARTSSTTTTTHDVTSMSDQKTLQEKPSQESAPTLAVENQVFQVVVMRVSIHCRGCAGKIKKHLSKLEGVTSFSVELEKKRVIVKGHLTPMEVLESISKIKRAELWPCLDQEANATPLPTSMA